MTGFIKPGEIYEAQKAIIELLDESDKHLSSLPDEVKAFMLLNPVTKEKESGNFRLADGVWVTEDSYEKAESLGRPLDELVNED